MKLEKKRVPLSAGEIAYADEGDGPPVVLLHGFPTSSHMWRDVVPMLAPRFRAIAPDLLGYGDSAKPEDPERLTIRAQAGHVREFLERLGLGELAVVGHDIGGGVAQLLALEGIVRTMVLIDTISFDSWPIEGVRMIQDARQEQVTPDFVEQVVKLALDLGMGHRDRVADEDIEEYVRPWRRDPMALVRAARGIDGVGLTGTEARLGGLSVRTLILWGEDDPYQPAGLAERLGDLMPGATVGLLPDCSHYVLEDAPEAVAPVIVEYLRTHHLGERHQHAGPTPVELGVSFERPDRPSNG